jgi:hypothetical protein
VTATQGVTTRRDRSSRSNRTAIEILAVLMLGIGSVATAWCGIQTSQWNGEEGRESRDAGLLRTESSELFSFGTQKFSYDANMAAQYAQAVADGDERAQQFIRENLMRPPFLPVLDRWEAEIAADGTISKNLFEDQEYIDSLFSESERIGAESEAALARSDEANKNGDDYLLMTLLTATALFFAGVTTSFGSRPARLALLAGSGLILAFTAARLIDLPVV